MAQRRIRIVASNRPFRLRFDALRMLCARIIVGSAKSKYRAFVEVKYCRVTAETKVRISRDSSSAGSDEDPRVRRVLRQFESSNRR